MEIVEIIEDHSGFVTARDCHLVRGENTTIKWSNKTKTDYEIHFHESPFQENDFTVKAGKDKDPIELKPEALPKTYAYDILPPKAKSGSVMAADPNVIVH
jgi:hypothetical protein